MKELKGGIIGCGGIANGKHLPAIKRNGDVEMVAFCDIVVERAENAAKAYGSEDFSVSVVKTDYSGSDARKMLKQTGDKVALFRYEGDTLFQTENFDMGVIYDGLYDHSKLSFGDAYGVYPVPDCGYARITLGNGREKLLLICDSYGDSLAPFLARHFDLDIIDPRYFGGSVKKLIEETNYTAALVCFGMDTLAGKEILYKLKV